MSSDPTDPSSDTPPFDADATLPYERPAAPASDSPHIAEISPVELLRRGLQSRPTSGAAGPWTPPAPEELARLLPQYQIESFLGRGGMGAVYKGRQTALDRPVAIKLLPAEMAADDSFIVRFQREAQTLARLQHPGIVAVYDFGQTGEGHLYFVMEYVDGTDLQRLLHGPGLSEGQSLEIVSQVCDALQYAHSQGVVHRDIKPANILVTAGGRAKLADFGLARPLHDDGFSLTRSNVVMGTPDYMAPEQLYGTPDHRADLFSLGVMLYEMLTGRPPRGSWLAPSQRVQVDVRIDDVVVRALAEDPEMRYQQASEIKSDVDRIRTTEIELPVPVPENASGSVAGRRGEGEKGRKAIVTVVAVLLLAGIGGAVLWQKGSAGTAARNESGDAVAPPQSAQDADKSVRAPVADPKAATKDSPFLNSLGMKFVPVPGTDVLFCIHETRYKDYAAYAKENPGVDSSWRNPLAGIDLTGEHPVWRANWHDAKAFCEWISKKEGRTYRLPTDEEWSVAVGLGGKEKRRPNDTPETLSGRVVGEYPWGTEWPPPAGAGNFSDLSRRKREPDPNPNAVYLEGDDGFPVVAPVMSFAPNTFGLYDMAGNMGEWVEDWLNAEQKLRVTRGSTWAGSVIPEAFRSSLRGGISPDSRVSASQSGFRLVLVPDAPAPKPEPPTTANPKQASKERPFVNSLGMKFVPVPGTEVLFCIHETRYRDYAAFAEENPGTNHKWKNPVKRDFDITEDHPAWQITWPEAKAFCEWISKKEGRTYRLPTDAEWSLAVGLGGKEQRAPDNTPESLNRKVAGVYYWGTEWPPPPGTGNYSDRSRKEKLPADSNSYYLDHDDGFPASAPVMSFPPNAFGLYDMGGNLMEWVEDWYNAEQQFRTLRDVGWVHSPTYLYNGQEFYGPSSARTGAPPEARSGVNGFRLVLVPDAPKAAPPKPEPPTTTNPKEASKDRPFVNGLGMKFVPVPGTDALFCIHETRYKDYVAYAKENPGGDGAWKIQTSNSYIITDRKEDHPVWLVSWEDAKAFCEWISRKEGRIYRLPTDEEWSVAVGLGGKEPRKPGDTPSSLNGRVADVYPWGTEWPPPAGTGNFSDQSRKAKTPTNAPDAVYWEGDDGFPATAPVMSFAPNAFGLHDMAGNMSECVEDWGDAEQKLRVIRGSAWSSSVTKHIFRSSMRSSILPASRASASIGFRLVLVPDAPKAAPPKAESPTTTNPKEASKDRPFANSFGMQFVPVPGMDALFCIHETRYKDYVVYARENSDVDGTWKNQSGDSWDITERNEEHPVCKVNWHDAQAFCEWISKKEGRTYRLPTDAEWSLAAGLGDKEKRLPNDTPQTLSNRVAGEYLWGTAWPPPPGAGNFSDQSRRAKAVPVDPNVTFLEGYDDGYPTTAPVMSFVPNAFGLYDMGGNVQEWVEDWLNPEQQLRTLRGAAWSTIPVSENNLDGRRFGLASVRQGYPPEVRTISNGFRLVLDPAPTKPE